MLLFFLCYQLSLSAALSSVPAQGLSATETAILARPRPSQRGPGRQGQAERRLHRRDDPTLSPELLRSYLLPPDNCQGGEQTLGPVSQTNV